jgi:predicted NodU family carbamoyl transferase
MISILWISDFCHDSGVYLAKNGELLVAQGERFR